MQKDEDNKQTLHETVLKVVLLENVSQVLSS